MSFNAKPMPPPGRPQTLSLSGVGAVLTARPQNSEEAFAPIVKKQRPQSAFPRAPVSSNRAAADAAGRRSYSRSGMVAFSEGPPVADADGQPRVAISGSAAPPSGRNRPQSAIVSMRGMASNSEKSEIEDLKAEILEITRKMQRREHGSKQRDKEQLNATEHALKGLVCSNDPSQVHMAKSALLAMVLQKHEEYQRHALSELERDMPSTRPGAGDDGRLPERPGGPGGARSSKAPQTRFAVMLGLVDTARGLRSDLQRKEKENEAGRQALDTARKEMAQLHEVARPPAHVCTKTTHYTLHTTHYTLHTTHFTLHTTH